MIGTIFEHRNVHPTPHPHCVDKDYEGKVTNKLSNRNDKKKNSEGIRN